MKRKKESSQYECSTEILAQEPSELALKEVTEKRNVNMNFILK